MRNPEIAKNTVDPHVAEKLVSWLERDVAAGEWLAVPHD
jgi:hypothetical protein